MAKRAKAAPAARPKFSLKVKGFRVEHAAPAKSEETIDPRRNSCPAGTDDGLRHQDGLSDEDWAFFQKHRGTALRHLTLSQSLRMAEIAQKRKANASLLNSIDEASFSCQSALSVEDDDLHESNLQVDRTEATDRTTASVVTDGMDLIFWRKHCHRPVSELTSEQLSRLSGMADKMRMRDDARKDEIASIFGDDGEALLAELLAEESGDTTTKVVVVSSTPLGTASDLKKAQKPFEQLLGKPLPMHHCDDIVGVRNRLIAEFPYAVDIIDSLLTPSLVQMSTGKTGVVIQPTVIVGPPGLGKTRMARKLCEALGVHFRCVSVAGYSDDMIFGLAKGWSTASASLMLDLVNESGTPNPVVILDEIEKVNQESRNGNIQQKLLPLLEKHEAKSWAEPLLGVPVDLSAVGWIFTANSLEGISQPLRSRLKCFHMKPPSIPHLPVIANTMRLDLASEQGVDPRWIRGFDVAEMTALSESYAEHQSVRILQQQVRTVIAGRHQTLQ